MAKEALRRYNWSAWHRFDAEVARTTVPDEPGVYELRTDFEFGRLRGSSTLVTIGSAVSSLRKRIYEQRLSNSVRYLNRAEKWLILASHTLEFRYSATCNGEEARYLEALRLLEYESEHWELPPGNEVLHLSAIMKQIEQKHGRLTGRALRVLLEHHRSPDEVARTLGVPPTVINNLLVYWGIRKPTIPLGEHQTGHLQR